MGCSRDWCDGVTQHSSHMLHDVAVRWAVSSSALNCGHACCVCLQGFAEVTNVGDNPPCSTLFVGNLSDEVSEAELHGLFAGQPGFKQIKVVRGAR